MSSSNEIYQQARARWRKCIDLSVHDDEQAVYPVTGLLKQALRVEPAHVPSLRLYCYLLVQIGATDEAREVWEQLAPLIPAAEKANLQAGLIDEPDRYRRLDWLFERWLRDEF